MGKSKIQIDADAMGLYVSKLRMADLQISFIAPNQIGSGESIEKLASLQVEFDKLKNAISGLYSATINYMTSVSKAVKEADGTTIDSTGGSHTSGKF